MKKVYLSESAVDTERIAAELAESIEPGDVVALFGGLGVGKTAFCRGFAKGLGYNDEVTSPTFAIVHEYLGGRLNIYHFDMYRIESFDELYSTGYFEYLESGGVVITEWSENIENVLPNKYYRVEMSNPEQNDRRKIEIELIDSSES
ncbi:MAG: tRNA (adenosine(37)-N6)-threonylcarbamoyltransferase complex ATPase subunit type 1 TsaE [Acutalibacteraceae bacterium]|nr:tRNA (adenosine(37)-N6)-threonylcarbamoyltransferase complex ATPase subunit type 1 TsaE [Acutalibacteraceae bacterium]